MPRVSNEDLERVYSAIASGPVTFHRPLITELILDLRDARTALKAIANWKDRTTDEAPLTFIERVAREVGG